MQAKFYLILTGAVIASFAGGFLVANSLNKAEIERLEVQKKQSEKAEESTKESELSDAEIRAKIKDAEGNPKDFVFQKRLGLALYRFAATKQRSELLTDVEKLLDRAHQLNPDDYEVMVSFANVRFDIAKINKDTAKLADARTIFAKALKKNPRDSRVLNNMAETFIDIENPEFDKAAPYLKTAFENNSMDTGVLRNLARVDIATGDLEKARTYIAKLKEIDPNNPAIARLESRITLEENR